MQSGIIEVLDAPTHTPTDHLLQEISNVGIEQTLGEV
jgi:hypothetical protein